VSSPRTRTTSTARSSASSPVGRRGSTVSPGPWRPSSPTAARGCGGGRWRWTRSVVRSPSTRGNGWGTPTSSSRQDWSPDVEATPGLPEAISAGWSPSSYLRRTAEATWAAIRATDRGRVVFTVPPEPAPAGGTALKPLFLACDHWRSRGVLDRIDVHLVTPYEAVLDLPFLDRRLTPHLERFSVTVHHRATVSAVDPHRRAVSLATDGGQREL